MRKFTLSSLFFIFVTIHSFCNPAPPVGIIVEVFFEGDDWFLVADNFCMEMYGIQSFDDVGISCNEGYFIFMPDFIPDFNSPRTIISQEALQNTISINQITDEIFVDFPGGYSFAFLAWGPSEQDEVSGPLPGQTLILELFASNSYFNYIWFAAKGDAPDCFYSGCHHTGVFQGFVLDENSNPVANAEIIYLPAFFYLNEYYFQHIVTNTNGHFQVYNMLAKNYHIHKIIVGEIECEMDEFVVIEPNETTSMDFEIILTGLDENFSGTQANIFSSPNPFSNATTFRIDLPLSCDIKNPKLIISDLMGRIVSIVEIKASQIKNNLAAISWEKDPSITSGIYIAALKSENQTLATHKITIE